jgi:F420-dependent oxidoreductase-like protein
MDHFMFPNAEQPDKEVPILECFTVLGALAVVTNRIRLGALVAGIPYRNPALFAKIHATLDVISHGRAIVGVGAGWHEPEFLAYGWPFPSVRERMEMLEEALQITDLMLRQRVASFTGKHYTIQNAYNDPLPIQKPRPPIMIGGSGEKTTLKLVAKYADYCNLFGDVTEVARLYGVLQSHCEQVGRPYNEIVRSNHVGILIARNEAELAAKRTRFPEFDGIAGTPNQVIEQLAAYAQVGSEYITFGMPDSLDLEGIQLIGEQVVPIMARL